MAECAQASMPGCAPWEAVAINIAAQPIQVFIMDVANATANPLSFAAWTYYWQFT